MGAVISTGANYLLAMRKERADAAKDKVLRANELKVAARLIMKDFAAANGSLESLFVLKAWHPGMAGALELVAWQRESGVLAREFSSEDWQAVSRAGHAVEVFRLYSREGGDPPLVAAQGVRAELEIGLNALRQYV